MEREGICRNVYLSTARTSGHSGQKDSLPRKRAGKRRSGEARSPVQGTWLLPRAISPRSSLPGHLSSITLWKPWSVVFLHCTVSVMKKKKKVLIHVNLCENYCVQQYFLVYLFFLCELSLFSFFIYKCLLFLKKDKPMCCRPICNLFLSLILQVCYKNGYFTWLQNVLQEK